MQLLQHVITFLTRIEFILASVSTKSLKRALEVVLFIMSTFNV